MNANSTQQPAQIASASSHPPPQTQQPVAAAHSSARQDTSTTPQSPLDVSEAPALPSTASWASKVPSTQMSRTTSRSASGFSGSPPSTQAAPAVPIEPLADEADVSVPEEVQATTSSGSSEALPPAQPSSKRPESSPFVLLIKSLDPSEPQFLFSTSSFSAEDLEIIKNYPPLFDENGGAKRRVLRQRQEEERRRLDAEERTALQTISAVEPEENLERSGSLQLGGEPEDRSEQSSQHRLIQPPMQHQNLGLESSLSLDADFSNLNMSDRGLTPQQLLLQQFKAPSTQGPSGPNQQSQGNPAQSSNPPGHARNVSRFTFANDTSSASAAVKPVANSKIMNQQSSMMPSQSGSSFGGNLQQQPFYTSTVSGPPPGLKTTGTPPVSGGGMFGQGHGFATSGLGYGANLTGRNSNDELMRDLLRRRDIGGSQASDAGKREYMSSSSFSHPPSSSSPANAPGLLNFPYHAQSTAFQDAGSQKPKKKGKKHRHANTSSSGGGAVDVADPSILQARLHQNGVPGGQGMYAGHGQGGLHTMYGGGGFGRW